MYKYETHLHTSATSACSYSSPKEQIITIYNAGYTGAVVTDHFMNGNSLVDKRLPWVKQVDAFAKGYYLAKEAAEHLDFDVFFAFEYSYSGTDFLVYGISPEQLKSEPGLLKLSVTDFFDWTHENNGFIIHAHPFRHEFYIPKIRLYTDYIDAVEVVNEGNKNHQYNINAFDYAIENSFPMTKGSDLHDSSKFKDGGIAVHKRANTIQDLIGMIKTIHYKSI